MPRSPIRSSVLAIRPRRILILDDLLLAAAHAGKRLVAVGEFGHVALSDDDGKTWRQAKTVPTQSTLTSVVFVDEKTGFAAGHDKTILTTADGGETWSVQYTREISAEAGIRLEPRGRGEEAAPVEDPALAPDGAAPVEGAPADDAAADGAAPADGMASADDSAIVDEPGASTSQDGFVDSDTSGTEPEPDVPFLGLVFTSPTHGIAVGGFNYAAETTDGGKTWTPRRLVKTASDDFHLNAAFAGPDGSLFVPSELGQVYRSLDGGKTWDITQTEYEGSFWGGLALKDGSVLVVGMRGNIWRSKDKGTTWEQLGAETTPESLSSGIQLDDGEIILVGIGGVILRSKDDGATWDTSLSQTDRKGIAAVVQGYDGVLLLMGEVGLRKKALDGTTPQG
ncbi:MAG: YCF48-related protein [Micropepsaceae bacterium]